MSARRLLVIALVLAASPAAAWQPIYSTRPVWRPPVPYSIHNAGSADLGFATSETETRRGMEDWTMVSCTSLTTTYRGATAARPGTYDGVSVIGWVESGWGHSGSAIGVTGPRWSSNIIEADMELNGVNYRWVTGGGSGSSVNTYSIVLHEGGHYYGLGHTDVAGSSMWPSYGGGVVSLGADDRAGICALYPGEGPSDCTVTGCPSGQQCVSGACQPITGDGMLCSPCAQSSQCSGGLCLGYPDGRGYCGLSCTSSSQCGTGGRCINTTGGPQCVRLVDGAPSCATPAMPSGCGSDSDCTTSQRCNLTTRACEARPTTGAALGQPCGADAECQSQLCLAGACSQSCDWLRPTSCPTGYYCDG
ncbi:MAG: matrixin family metalloprotease, partial [Sandaracinaceae bacterium]|nr:matrixin family metalloprotease [Sandaracinaceae bacterium]